MKNFLFVIMLIGLSGCAILQNLDGVFTLQDYSGNKDGQHRLVKEINAHYDALIKIIEEGHISDYKDETSFTSTFGDPILKKNLADGHQRWLYRYAVYKYAKDKVYVYFDSHGQLIKWERLPCPKLF